MFSDKPALETPEYLKLILVVTWRQEKLCRIACLMTGNLVLGLCGSFERGKKRRKKRFHKRTKEKASWGVHMMYKANENLLTSPVSLANYFGSYAASSTANCPNKMCRLVSTTL